MSTAYVQNVEEYAKHVVAPRGDERAQRCLVWEDGGQCAESLGSASHNRARGYLLGGRADGVTQGRSNHDAFIFEADGVGEHLFADNGHNRFEVGFHIVGRECRIGIAIEVIPQTANDFVEILMPPRDFMPT